MAQLYTRTRLVSIGCAAAFAATVSPVADAATRIVRRFDGSARFRRSTYLPHLNSTFRIRGTRTVEATLVEVTGSASAQLAQRQGADAFSLILRAAAGNPLPQGEYAVEHRSIGTIRLFLVPVGRGVKGQEYQAVINGATVRA